MEKKNYITDKNIQYCSNFKFYLISDKKHFTIIQYTYEEPGRVSRMLENIEEARWDVAKMWNYEKYQRKKANFAIKIKYFFFFGQYI